MSIRLINMQLVFNNLIFSEQSPNFYLNTAIFKIMNKFTLWI